MKIRGNRRCRDCGHEWSYYETGSVSCPACDSLRSVGVDERKRHTDSPVQLDLSEARQAVDEGSLRDRSLVNDLKSTLRAYRRGRGFVSGGELADLDDTFLAAGELLHAVDVYARDRTPTDDERIYVLELLRGADRGKRPDPDAVPPSMAAARGLAYAETLSAYRRDLGTWLDDNPHPEARSVTESLGARVKRVEALQGDVPVRESESLVRAARDIASYLRDGDETALATARDRIERT